MWFIIKTDFYKERDAIADLLQLEGIKDIYFPNPRQDKTETAADECSEVKTSSFAPAINGILFAYVSDIDLLKVDLNVSGYFLRKKKLSASSANQNGGVKIKILISSPSESKWLAMPISSRSTVSRRILTICCATPRFPMSKSTVIRYASNSVLPIPTTSRLWARTIPNWLPRTIR